MRYIKAGTRRLQKSSSKNKQWSYNLNFYSGHINTKRRQQQKKNTKQKHRAIDNIETTGTI